MSAVVEGRRKGLFKRTSAPVETSADESTAPKKTKKSKSKRREREQAIGLPQVNLLPAEIGDAIKARKIVKAAIAVLVLLIGGVVCTALSMTGSLVTEFKISYWLGATPRRVEWSNFIGAAVSSVTVTAMIMLFAKVYGYTASAQHPTPMPAPQANAMAAVIQKLVRRFVELFPGDWHEISPTEVFARVQIEDANALAGIKGSTERLDLSSSTSLAEVPGPTVIPK